MRKLSLIFGLFLILIIVSCNFSSRIIKNPCQCHDIIYNLHQIDRKDLYHLQNRLKNITYKNMQDKACNLALLAQINYSLKEFTLASDYFKKAAQKLPDLAPYFLFATANIEVERMNYRDAKKIAESLVFMNQAIFSKKFELKIHNLLLDISIKEKDKKNIFFNHDYLIKKGFRENEALLFNLAQTLEELGEKEYADNIYKKLLINFPHTLEAKKIKSISILSLNTSEQEKRFNELIKHLAYDEVVSSFDLVSKSYLNKKDQSTLASLTTKALIYNNKFNNAIALAKDTKKLKDPVALENYAFTLGKLDRPLKARDAYLKLQSIAIDDHTKAKACFLAGFSLYEANLYSQSRIHFQSCLKTANDSSFYEDILWYEILCAILQDDFLFSKNYLYEIIKKFPNSKEKNKYKYFLAYSYEQLNDKANAHGIYKNLIESKMPTYYSLLSSKALKKDIELKTRSDDEIMDKKYAKSKYGSLDNALLLANFGFKDMACDLISNSPFSLMEKIILWQMTNNFDMAYAKSHLLNDKWQIFKAAFPLPYNEIVEKVTKTYEVKNSLLYAIMKTESGFFENAKSQRGAFGLMQLMPFMAEDLALHSNIKNFSPSSLKDPRVAIELGAMFLAILNRHLEHPHLIISAYNAGLKNVKKWQNQFGHLPFALFVERIPFKETRNYVKSVLTDESIYRALSFGKLKILL